MSESQQFECSDCGAITDQSDACELSTVDLVCSVCFQKYFACSRCGGYAPRSERGRTERGSDICGTCQSDYFTHSGIQGCFIDTESVVTLQDSGEDVSDSWAEEHAYRSDAGLWYQDEENLPTSLLLEHDENVLTWCKFDRKRLGKGSLVFGVELEMEPTGDASQGDIIHAFGGCARSQYILKEDGSLEDGVELVTVPLTLEEHLTRFGWEQVLAPVRNVAKSGVGTNRCGMHVHVNKAALSSLQIGKMLVFLNSIVMRDYITTIAQRESNTYCTRSAKKVTDGSARSDSRYDIVNVGGATVEIRMFRGNLRTERVFKNLEFCHALVLFCRDASLTEIERWDEFAAWLLTRRSQYPHLVRFLADTQSPRFKGAVRPRKGAAEEVVTCA
jgi:hypothetical protein